MLARVLSGFSCPKNPDVERFLKKSAVEFTKKSQSVTYLAFSRSFVFMLITMIVLPLILGVNGIWLATPGAELMALALSVSMFLKYRKRYGY